MEYLAIETPQLALLVMLVMFAAPAAQAQMGPMGIPIITTLVMSKPAPEQIYADEQIITMGVGAKEYKFVLNDAYVDSTRIRWSDIWEQVRVYRPNFVVQGPHADEIKNLKPGEMRTVKAMYAPLDRTFEIVFTAPGKGPFETKKKY